MGNIFDGPDSVMGRIFDGPTSVMGQIFGEGVVANHQPQKISIKLTREMVARLATGESLHFLAEDMNIEVVPYADSKEPPRA